MRVFIFPWSDIGANGNVLGSALRALLLGWSITESQRPLVRAYTQTSFILVSERARYTETLVGSNLAILREIGHCCTGAIFRGRRVAPSLTVSEVPTRVRPSGSVPLKGGGSSTSLTGTWTHWHQLVPPTPLLIRFGWKTDEEEGTPSVEFRSYF